MKQQRYKFKNIKLKAMKWLVPSVVALCKRGEVWGQRYISIRVWRDGDGFSGVMKYETPPIGESLRG